MTKASFLCYDKERINIAQKGAFYERHIRT